ncbi:MAG: response regulator [Flavobacteriia bacterium]|nr:response regulator [Flavobacteriia bacterium]
MRESGYSKPIISLTAGALKEDKEKSLDAGMDDYLSKPIQMDELKSVLKKYLD